MFLREDKSFGPLGLHFEKREEMMEGFAYTYSFKRNPYSGLFLDIESLDGSGSSTQIEHLVRRLRQKGPTVYTTKEPTDNLVGGLIRAHLTKEVRFPSEVLQLLFSADRGHHLKRVVTPVLERGDTLVTDRYLWSTVAFGSLDLPREWLLSLNSLYPLPDLTILLKVRPEVCLSRIDKSRFQREYFEEEEKLMRVWATYEWLAGQFLEEIKIVDGEGAVEEVAEAVYGEVSRSPKLLECLARISDKG